MKWLCLIFLLGYVNIANSKKIKIKYKEREKVDLGLLAVDGEVFAPGDISISDDRKWESNSLYERTNFKDKIQTDLKMAY